MGLVIVKKIILLGLMCFTVLPVYATNNLMTSMMTSMIDAFADSKFAKNNHSFINARSSKITLSAPTLVDGVWKAQNGRVLLMKQGLSRLYFSQKQYQDQQFRVSPGFIQFREVKTGLVRIYQYHLNQNQLLLRTENGKELLFIRYQRLKY